MYALSMERYVKKRALNSGLLIAPDGAEVDIDDNTQTGNKTMSVIIPDCSQAIVIITQTTLMISLLLILQL